LQFLPVSKKFADVMGIIASNGRKKLLSTGLKAIITRCSPYFTFMSVTRLSCESPVKTLGRGILLGMALAMIAGFLVALMVTPDPRGFGTHQQLGLPPCTFRLLLGYPCPACGMTTSFAYFVRGHFVDAAQASLAGVVLAATCALMIPWCLFSAAIGRTWMVSDPVTFGAILAIVLCGLTVVLWAVRMIGYFV
jgi:hypothetical protein